MKTKFFTLLALCLTLSTFTTKAAFGEWNFTVASKAPNGYFGSSPSLCTYQVVTDGISATKFGRFTRPSTAALTDGLQWGAVDRTLSVQYQVVSIPGGNVNMGTTKGANTNEYLIVRMRKNTSGAPQVLFYSSTQSNTITSATTVVTGEWVSYLFDVANVSAVAYKMFTVIPDKDNKACVTDILDCTFTNSPISISVSSNNLSMGTVSGNGTYAVIEGTAFLVATPKAGYRFVNWTEGGTPVSGAGASYSFTVSTTRTLVANFAAGYNIYATATGGTISGLATNGSYNAGDAVSLTAIATGSNRFIGWIENGSIVSTNLNLSFTATSNRTLVAMFAAAGNYTSAAPSQLFYEYGTTGGGSPANGTLGSIAIDYVGLSNNVSIVPPSNYEISLSNSPFVATNPITLTQTSGNVPYTTIYIHLKEGLTAATYNQTLPITSTGMTTVNVSLTGAVNKKNVYINSPILKTYDGALVATVAGAYGVVGSDAVSITGTFGAAGYTGTVTQPTSGLSGAQSANYQVGSILWGKVVTAPLTISGITGVDKYYDGNTTATLGGTASYSGLQNSESFTVTGTPSATFANASVANNKSITVTGYTTPSVNYTLTQPTGLTANITVKPLTLPDAAATSKIYDGTNAAVITGTLTGKVGSEDVSFNGTGTFAVANVANGISVSSTSSLTGSASGNYSLTQPTGLTANITSLGLTVSSPSATSKSYDGNANIAVSGTLLTPIGGDDVSLNTTGTVTNANIGTGKTVTVSLSGAKAGNYSLTQPSGLVANITPASANSTGGNISTSGFTVQDLANTNITVTSGELVIDQNSSIHGIAVNSGAKLSLNSGSTLSTGALTLDNNGTGHGTFVDANSNGGLTVTGSTTVNQYLGAARNWYISSPISNATAPSGYTYYKYHEAGDNENLTPLYTTAYWENIGATPSLTTGTGYVANLASGTATYSLTGTLNTGEVPLTLSRSGALLPGFNLVGNPYPSFLDISTLASNSDLVPTYWVRSKNGSYVFDTYNIPGGISTGLSGFEVTSKIAPMQAFWLRVKSGSSSASVVFTNAMRAHQDDTNNKFRITNALKQQVLRLQVSDGISTDETVLYTNSAASNDFDVYDSQKMSSSNISIPEIYTLVDGEHLTINGLNSIPYEVELPLGFTSGQSNTFNFKATQFNNFDAGTRILLKDYADINNPVITDLTDGSSYSFTTDITNNNTNRFTLTFKAPSVATGFNPESNTNVWISAKNGQIVVNGVTNGATLEVFNAVGQKVISRNLTELSVQPNNLPAGAYMVKVTYGGKSITRKIILD